jgi:hypothetical protein
VIIGDQTVLGDTTLGGAPLVLASAGQMLTSLIATAGPGADAIIEVGYRGSAEGSVWYPMVGPVILPAGTSSRIRLPALRINQGGAFVFMARSSAPVSWSCNTTSLQVAGAGDTALRQTSVQPRVRTAIFGPAAASPKWRGVSILFCNASAAVGLVSLSSRFRIPGGDLSYKNVAGPVLVPPFGSVRLSPFPNVDFAAETAMYGISEVAGSFLSYGVQIK